MPTFVVGDRVKVVRESESDPEFNYLVEVADDRLGTVKGIDTRDSIHFVHLDSDAMPYYIPADMLELEGDNG